MNMEREYKSIVTRLGISLIFFLVVFSSLTGTVSIIGDWLIEIFPRSNVAYIAADLGYSLSYLVSFVLPVPLFYLISKGVKSHRMSLNLTIPEPHPLWSYCGLVLAGLAIILPMASLNSMLFPVIYDAVEMFSLDFSQPYKFVLAFISTAVIPPFAEELLFRGLLISNLKPYGKGSAVIISAVAFGLIHQNPLQILYATVAGIVFGIVYVETESIWCCIAIHFVNNFISVMQTYYAWRYGEYVTSLGFFVVSVALCAAGLVCTILLLLGRNKKQSPQTGFFGRFDGVENQKNSGGSLSVVLKNPAMIIFAAACIGECVWLALKLSSAGLGG